MQTRSLLLLVLLLSVLASCATPARFPILSDRVAMETDTYPLTVEEANQRVEAAVVQAESEALATYAPTHFAEILASERQYRKEILKGNGKANAFRLCRYIEVCVEAGLRYKTQFVEAYPDTMESLDILSTLGTPELYPAKDQAIRTRLTDLARTLEAADKPKAEILHATLTAQIRKLEVQAVKETNDSLTEAKGIVQQLNQDRLALHAPKTALNAETLISEAEATIRDNPRDGDGIGQMVTAALQEARHARQVADTAKGIKEGTAHATYEDLVLEFEAALQTAAVELPEAPVNHLPLTEQARQLGAFSSETIEHLKLEIARLQEAPPKSGAEQILAFEPVPAMDAIPEMAPVDADPAYGYTPEEDGPVETPSPSDPPPPLN